jgi:hypothetical protein
MLRDGKLLKERSDKNEPDAISISSTKDLFDAHFGKFGPINVREQNTVTTILNNDEELKEEWCKKGQILVAAEEVSGHLAQRVFDNNGYPENNWLQNRAADFIVDDIDQKADYLYIEKRSPVQMLVKEIIPKTIEKWNAKADQLGGLVHEISEIDRETNHLINDLMSFKRNMVSDPFVAGLDGKYGEHKRMYDEMYDAQLGDFAVFLDKVLIFKDKTDRMSPGELHKVFKSSSNVEDLYTIDVGRALRGIRSRIEMKRKVDEILKAFSEEDRSVSGGVYDAIYSTIGGGMSVEGMNVALFSDHMSSSEYTQRLQSLVWSMQSASEVLRNVGQNVDYWAERGEMRGQIKTEGLRQTDDLIPHVIYNVVEKVEKLVLKYSTEYLQKGQDSLRSNIGDLIRFLQGQLSGVAPAPVA